MGRPAKPAEDAPLTADLQESLQRRPVLGPEAKGAGGLRGGQIEAEKRSICLGLAAVRAVEASASPEPPRLDQFPRFAPIIAAL